MTAARHLGREDLAGKVVDCHSHAGVSIKAYAAGEYPYAATIEGLRYRQLAGRVDASVVFPFTADLHFDPVRLLRGEMVPAPGAPSPLPYGAENRLLMREVFDICPELSGHFIPFVCIDPGRDARGQVTELESLDYPIYGVKVNPVGCQSHVGGLLGEGAALLDFAEERGLPLLFHTSLPNDEYTPLEDIFRIVDSRPALRFCLAHCILFDRESLRRAGDAINVWVDTAALKIQVEMVRSGIGETFDREALIDADWSDHRSVMATLCEMLPDTIVWGTDAPCYSYMCRRKQGEDEYTEFALKGLYEDEVQALDSLPPGLRAKVGGENALDFIFGR